MDEYISREETIKRIEECYCTGCNRYNGVRCRACGTGDAIDMIEDVTAADVSTVRHGRWNDSLDRITPYCSACGHSHRCLIRTPNYCPNCGAKMDGGDSNAVN